MFRTADGGPHPSVPSNDSNVSCFPPTRQLGLLCSKFDHRRRTLLEARKLQAASLDGGEGLQFLKDPDDPAKDPSWRCAPVPEDIQDRRVEITG